MQRRRARGRGGQSSWRRQARGGPSWRKIRALEAPAELLRGRWLANNCFPLQNLGQRKAGGEGKWQTSLLFVSRPFVLQTNHRDPLVLSSCKEKEQRGKGGLCLGVWTKMVSLFTVWAKHQHDEPKPQTEKRRGGGGEEEEKKACWGEWSLCTKGGSKKRSRECEGGACGAGKGVEGSGVSALKEEARNG